MSEKNKAIVRRFVEEVQNRGNIDAIDELLAPDFIDHSGFAVPPTREGAKQLFTAFWAAFPDLQTPIHDQIAEGDKVVTRKTHQGTHRGEFMGIPPTHKHASWLVIDIMKVVDGKITEHWASVDQLGLMQQLGVIPAPGQEGS